jgi:hypothetical protein
MSAFEANGVGEDPESYVRELFGEGEDGGLLETPASSGRSASRPASTPRPSSGGARPTGSGGSSARPATPAAGRTSGGWGTPAGSGGGGSSARSGATPTTRPGSGPASPTRASSPVSPARPSGPTTPPGPRAGAGSGGGGGGSGFRLPDFLDRIGGFVQPGLQLLQQGGQIVSQFTGGNNPFAGAPPPAAEPGAPMQPAQPTQPSWAPAPTPEPFPPGMYPPPAGMYPTPPAGMYPTPPAGMYPMPPAPPAAPLPGQVPPLPGMQPAAPQGWGPPRLDATNLLGMILGNPQLQQALQLMGTYGAAAPRTMGLPVPGAGGMRMMPIPLGAVMNTIGALTGPALMELNQLTGEDDPEVPEYLVGESGEFLVDPTSSDERAALVAELFRVAAASGESPETMDESELWAREAGFDETDEALDETSENWSPP